MKQFYYKTLAFMAMLLVAWPAAAAAEWSYDWPVSATAEKNTGYQSGFYNFGSNFDSEITSITRTLEGMDWTISFDQGTKLTYLATSGQAVGASGGFSSYFSLTSASFSGKIKRITVSTRSKVADAMLTISVNGVSYECGGNASVCYTAEGTTPNDYTFTPGAEGEQEGEIVMNFTIPGATNNAFVKKITVEYEEVVSNVETPVMTPGAGSFDEPVEVTISGPEGAQIFYTTDGSNPRTEGNEAVKEYAGAIGIETTTTLKAVAKDDGEYSAVAEGTYVIRRDPGLKFMKESLTIELLEEDLAMLDNPNKVEPVKFSSSDSRVAWADEHGVVYTYSVGEAVISATFAGNDTYKPQTVSIPVTVVAKEPLAGLTVTPAGGTYEGVTEVTVECTDERAMAIWYHIGDKAMGVDDLGLLDEYTIHTSTRLTLRLDESCVLTVQAVGQNVWSEPQVNVYTVNIPLKADFEGGENMTVVYSNGFDSEDEANEWNRSSGSSWQLTSETGLSGLPAFSSINPDSRYSLFHGYASGGDTSVITSPDITVPEGGKVRFYAAFNPVWLYYGNLQLYVCENADGATPVKIWDAFLTSQEAATDDIKWNQYSVGLDEWAGKEVYFAFTYELNYGDNVLIDDFEVVAPAEAQETVKVMCGEPITFRDLSEGKPEGWEWSFPGAMTPTSAEQNPTVVYETPGTYDVTLTVRKGDKTNTRTRTRYVVATAVPPTARIGVPSGVYYSPEAGLAVPLNTPVTFTDASAGAPTSRVWTLPGTDLGTSEEKDVTVKYLSEGTYDVDLTVSSEAGTSSTYLTGVKAGGETRAWNIGAHENENLGIVALGWYGSYGGTNWLDMDAFAEEFEAPAVPVTISSVSVYFAKADVVTQDADITVSVTKADENGLPGEVICSTSLMAAQIVDASETYNDPTEFTFDQPVKVDHAFFVTISGFPNESSSDGEDNVVMYTLRRNPGERCTTYHLLKEYDADYQPTGESKWYKQDEEACSFAIAPKLTFDDPEAGVENVGADITADGPATYYNLQGIRVDADNLTPGVYIRQQGGKSEKTIIR